VKRGLDVTIAATVLVLFAPLWAVIGAVIRLTSPGPALFRMKGVFGKDGRRFTMYKFRTMRVSSDVGIHKDAFKRFAEGRPVSVKNENGVAVPVYKVVDDPRVTRVGRLLRKTGLDEVPQLLNVLRGEMSIVGPRPSQDYEYAYYNEQQRRRFSVLPGITGLHQVTARSNVPFDEMVRLDLEYVDTRSTWLDLRIMAKTVWVALTGRGAY
jgi:lipopolysaccharide/colanic/teichoic acid biosynthesis glycosyltransferase